VAGNPVLFGKLLIYDKIHTNETDMKKIKCILISLGLIWGLVGCGGKSMVVLLPDLEGHVGQVVVATDGGQRVLSEANHSVQARGRKAPPGEVTILSADEIRSTFSDALAAEPLPPVKFILYFVMNSNELNSQSKAVLSQILQAIQDRNPADIVISGFTDTVGTMEYNYKLALDRAKVIYDILVANGAVPANITVTSYGKENPPIKTADNVAEPRNRRVEVVIK
jgi:outer membrane protein OmpA-like peptidoglycan-associated protein